MVFYVNRATIEACTECPRGHACLHESRQELCRVSGCVDGAMHFVVCVHEGPCPYKHSVWDRILCNCPIRREIHNKYKA
jgi:hypothetical protein